MKCYVLILLLICKSGFVFCQENKKVFFDFDKYNLNNNALNALEFFISNKDDFEITKIYGYCDWKGSNNYNDSLSVKRVNEVFKFLKKNEVIINSDYQIKGYGEDFKQSETQAENRKVVIVFERKKPIIIEKIKNVDSTITLLQKIKNAKPGDLIKLENINFRNNSAVIVPKSKPVLYDLLCVLEENPKLKIQIQGHICCQSVADYNDISTSRARAIYVYLIRNKINKSRISFKGFGISKPKYAIPEKNEKEEDENRRVEILILEN